MSLGGAKKVEIVNTEKESSFELWRIYKEALTYNMITGAHFLHLTLRGYHGHAVYTMQNV